MAINLADLIDISPYLYHVTYSTSLARIKRYRRLDSAARLMEAGGRGSLLRQRRTTLVQFSVDGESIILTDQLPIIEANIAFQEGWTLPDLIEAINRRVFFWRGPATGLLKKDQGHFGTYESAGPSLTFLRVKLREACRLNSERGPELCKYNSGAARMNDGLPIPRGPRTFVEPRTADFEKGIVREVVFRDHVLLPDTTECCVGSWEGEWKSLFETQEVKIEPPESTNKLGGVRQ
jgi:hypothetical protein